MITSTTSSRLSEVLAGYPARIHGRDCHISGMTLDSRTASQGDLFVARRGARLDGGSFVSDAIERGCTAVLMERFNPSVSALLDQYPDLGVAELPELDQHLGALAARFHGDPSQQLEVIGVTGTNGKTSCVQMLAQALQGSGEPVGTIGTLGTGLVGKLVPELNTTPDVISVHRKLAEFATQGCQHAAMEVSSHALSQKRVAGVHFSVAALTNLSRDHLDYHGTMDAYGRAKALLFLEYPVGMAVINTDDPFGQALWAQLPRTLSRVSYGLRDADVLATQVVSHAAGLSFYLRTPWGEGAVESGLVGHFNVENLLLVAACLGAMGVPFDQLLGTLSELQPVPGRMQRVGGPRGPLVVVDYAHTPDALAQALQSLRAHTSHKLICIFGCGGDRDAGKRPIMAATAERLADYLILTDDNPRAEDGDQIIRDMKAGLKKSQAAAVVRDRRQAIAQGIELARPQDTVLIAGKGHEDYQEVDGHRYPLSDVDEAAAALAQWGGA